MKIGFSPNYYVQVFPDAWEEDPEQAALHEGIVTVSLNMVLSVRFIPDVSAAGPPWRAGPPADEGVPFTTAAQVREYDVLNSDFSVTPHPALAGQVGEIPVEGGSNLVFYVTSADFAVFADELDKLTDIASDAVPSARRDDILDRAVIRFLDTVVLQDPRVLARRGRAVGRGPGVTAAEVGP